MVLLTSIPSIPAIQSQPPTQTPSAANLSQLLTQISEKVATANHGTNAVFIEQILRELARHVTSVSSLEEIYSQISTYPYGIVSQSLARFASLLANDSSMLLPIVQKIIQEEASGRNTSQSIVNIAVQDASGGGKNVNDEIALAAQIIAKQSPGIPVENIESIIIQMALEISRAQGKAITGQTIFEIASQIKQNPNGVLTQAIIQLARQDTHDSGKTGQTTDVIQKIVRGDNGGDGKDVKEGSSKSCPSGYERAKDGSNICLKKYDSCPAGSANPDEGCTLEGPQYGPEGYGYYAHGVCETCQRFLGPQTSPTQPQPTPLPTPQTIGEKAGEIAKLIVTALVDAAAQRVLGSTGPQFFGAFLPTITAANPSVPQPDLKTMVNDLILRTANIAGPSQSLQAATTLHEESQSNPALLQKMGQLAQAYQNVDDVYASEASNAVAEKLARGLDPAVALEETPIPEPEISLATDQMSGEAEPASTGEIEVKSFPPYDGDLTIQTGDGGMGIGSLELPAEPVLVPSVGSAIVPGLGILPPQLTSPLPSPDTNTLDSQPEAITKPESEPLTPADTEGSGADVVEPELTSDQPFVQEPSGSEGSPIIPGFGPLSQPPLFQERITSLPPDDIIVEDQPEVNTASPLTAPPLTASTSDICQIDPGLCEQQEPLAQFPCQEQPDLPQCTQADNNSGEDTDIEYSDVSDENTAFSYFDQDIGGYQQNEEDYSEENGEEEDYEEVGGYNAAEEDYGEEEDSGDEEDDYEEVGGYQEEEEQYSEEDSGEEEDFSEEEEESVEYYEE